MNLVSYTKCMGRSISLGVTSSRLNKLFIVVVIVLALSIFYAGHWLAQIKSPNSSEVIIIKTEKQNTRLTF